MLRFAKRSERLVLAAVLALCGAPAMAQKQTPPAGGPPKPFNVPPSETYSLPNGLKVTLIPYGALPKVTISLVARCGTINQSAGQTGIANLTGNLLKEGTTSRSAKALAEQAAQMGGAIDVAVGDDETSISTDVLSEFGPDAVKLVADVAQHPLLSESELPRLRNDALRRLAIARSQPQSLALERFRQILYPGHPYGLVFSTPEILQKLTIEDARKFYQANFGAARGHLYVAGRFADAATKKAITEAFGGWANGPEPLINVPKVVSHRVLDITDRPGAAQSTLYIGLPVPDASSPDNIPLGVMNALLGGAFDSRITANIREQKGYTYSPFSQVSRRYRDAYWVEVADVTTGVTGPALKEIFREIERLRKEPPKPAELQGIESYISGIFVIQNSSRQALIGQVRFVDLNGLRADYLKTYIQKVNAVTPEDVRNMVNKYINPDQMTIVVAGDKAKISDQLAGFGTPAP